MAAKKFELISTLVASVGVAAVGVALFFKSQDAYLLFFAALAAAFIWGMFALRLIVRGPLGAYLGVKLAMAGSVATRVITILGIVFYLQTKDSMLLAYAGVLLVVLWGGLVLARRLTMDHAKRAA